MVLAYLVGAGTETDAYRAAFQVPDLLNYFLGTGAFSIALLPLYTRHLSRGDPQAADRLLATVLGTLTAVAAIATALLWWWAEPVVALQFPLFEPEKQALTVRLTRIVLPAQVFFLAGGILRTRLLARGWFGAQAAAPVVYNCFIIAGGLGLAPALGVEGFAWGALAGAIVGPFAITWLHSRRHARLRPRFAFLDRELLGYLVVAAPLMIGATLLTVDEWYERWFGGLLAAGTIAQLGFARQLMLTPVAMVGQAVGVAALPAFSRLFAEGRGGDLARVMLRTLQAVVGIGVLAGAAFVALAEPLVKLLFQRGAFTRADADAVAAILVILCLGVPGWVAQQVAVRAFYARADFWRPMLLGTAIALAAIPLYLALGERLGAVGLAAAGVLAISANALATLVLARRLHGAPSLSPLLATALRATLVAVPAGLAAAAVPDAQEGLAPLVLQLLLGGGLFAGLAVLGVFVVGDPPLRDTVWRILRRLGSMGRPKGPGSGTQTPP